MGGESPESDAEGRDSPEEATQSDVREAIERAEADDEILIGS